MGVLLLLFRGIGECELVLCFLYFHIFTKDWVYKSFLNCKMCGVESCWKSSHQFQVQMQSFNCMQTKVGFLMTKV